MTIEQQEIIQEFIQECHEILEQLEPTIIELEQKGDDQALNSIFRFYHSIKGGAGFMGLPNLAHVTHAAESLLDQIRSGKISLQHPKHVDLLCQACDFIKEALDYLENHPDDKGLEDHAGSIASKLEEAIKEDS